MSYIKNNPYSIFVKFQIGDTDLSYNPQEHVMSLDVVKSSTLSYAITLTLYDDDAFEIERLILSEIKSRNESSKATVFLQYGISHQNESPVMRLSISDYEIEFNAGRTTLTLTMITYGFSSYGKPRCSSYVGSTSDIVRQIAGIEGWGEGYIEDTIPILDEYTGGSKVYIQENVPSFRFIKEKLIIDSVSIDTKQSNYMAYFSEINGKTHINFCDEMYKNVPKIQYYYDVYHPDNSNVISFSCKPENLASHLLTGTSMKGCGFDPITKEYYTVEYEYSSNTSRVVVGPRVGFEDTTQYYQLGNVTKEQGERIIMHNWYINHNAVYEADMEIVGNPNIIPNETLSVVIYSRDGRPHYTSGVYLIKEITDSIEGGSFTTSLSLKKNGMNVGNMNALGKKNY